MKKLEPLEFSKNETNASVTKKISDRVKSVPLNEVIKELQQDFIFQEEAIRKMYIAFSTGKNLVLWGPGGFSKSVLVKAFCKFFKLPLITKVGHSESSVEELLGLPNMKKLLDESTYETAFENSVFSKPSLLLLEEFTDVRPSVAAALKDVLTEKGLREKDLFKESLVSSVIITGNTNPEELSVDDSIKAFYKERFPFWQNVVWDDFSEESYFKFFQIYFKEDCTKNEQGFILLAKLCAETKGLVSPRIAGDAGDVLISMGIEYIDTISGIDTSGLTQYKQDVEIKYKHKIEKELLDKIKNKVSVLASYINSSKSNEEHVKSLFLLRALYQSLPTNIMPENLDYIIFIKKSIEEAMEAYYTIIPQNLKFLPLLENIRNLNL